MIPGLIPGLLLVLSSHAVGTGDGHDYHASARDGSWRGGPRSSDCPSPIHFSPQRQFRYADVAEPPQRRFLFGREDWTAAMSGSEEGDRTGTCMLRDRSGLSRPAAQLALRGGGSESSEEDPDIDKLTSEDIQKVLAKHGMPGVDPETARIVLDRARAGLVREDAVDGDDVDSYTGRTMPELTKAVKQQSSPNRPLKTGFLNKPDQSTAPVTPRSPPLKKGRRAPVLHSPSSPHSPRSPALPRLGPVVRRPFMDQVIGVAPTRRPGSGMDSVQIKGGRLIKSVDGEKEWARGPSGLIDDEESDDGEVMRDEGDGGEDGQGAEGGFDNMELRGLNAKQRRRLMDELLSPGGLEDEEEEAFDFIDQEPDSEETRKRQLDLDDEDLVRKLQDELSSLNSSELRESSVDSNGRRLDPGEKEMRFSRKVDRQVGVVRNPEIEATDDPGDDLKGYDMATEEEREQVNNNFRRMALEEYNKGMGGKLWRTHVTEAIEKRDTDKLEQIADQIPFEGHPENSYWPWCPNQGIGENFNSTRDHMEKLHEELITALFADDPDEVRRLHSIGADINMRDYMSEGHGATPLQYSILYNRTEVTPVLLELGANVDKGDFFDNTPLFYCAQVDDHVTATALIARGANVSLVESIHGTTALHQAAYFQSDEVLGVLIKAGAIVDAVCESQHQTPLFFAAIEGWTDIVEILLEHGADPCHRDEINYQPYLSAQEWDHWETAQVLIAAMGNKYVKLKPDTFPRPPGRLPKTGELTNPDPEEEEERDGWGSVVDDSSYEKGKFDLDDSDEGAQGVNEVLGNGGGGGDGDGAEEEAEVEEEDD